MSENNFTIKATARNQSPVQSDGVFNQHKFISDIYECEKQKYILEKRYAKLMNSIKQKEICPEYCNTKFCKEYNKEKRRRVQKPYKPTASSGFSLYDLWQGAIIGVPSGIGFTILHLIVHKIVRGSMMEYELGFGILFAIIVTIAVIIKNHKDDDKYYAVGLRRYKEECIKVELENKEIDEYNHERSEYWHNEYDKYKNEIIENANKYKELVMPEVNEIKKNYTAVKDTLKSLYNLRLNGVLCLHPNYQGLVPISIIYGYFDTGRCSQLQGHEGAYNLYEDEKMKGMIIGKLNVVLKQLNQLNRSMIYVGKAIEECNSRLSDLESAGNRMISSVNNMNSNVSDRLNGVSNQMSAIEANTANSAYYAEVGERMSTFNTVYNLLSD